MGRSRVTDEWEPRLVRVPKGAHRSVSHDTPGADRELLREDGTNKLLGPPESIPFDPYGYQDLDQQPPPEPDKEWELSPDVQEVVDTLGALLGEAAWAYSVKTAKHVGPVVKQKASAFGNRLRKGSRSAVRQAGSSELVSHDAGSSNEIEAAAGTTEVEMTLAEFREGCQSPTPGRAVPGSDEGSAAARASIADGDLSPELDAAIKAVLEGNTVALDEQSFAILMSFLAKEESADEVDPLSARRVVSESPRI